MGRTETTQRDFLRGLAGGATAGTVADEAVAQGQQTIEMTDNLVYNPDSVTVAPGITVVWQNTGSIGHSVTAYENEIPGEAEYFASGGFDSEQAARQVYPEGEIGSGEQYQHTFQVEGSYRYFCIPHETAGMVTSLEVATGGGTTAGGGGGALPAVPNSAKTLSVATVSALSVGADVLLSQVQRC